MTDPSSLTTPTDPSSLTTPTDPSSLTTPTDPSSLTGTDVQIGADGLARCPWAGNAPEYLAYHDDEWGRPVHGEVPLYERLTLEAFQSGLSWLTILRKRESFRAAFRGFDPDEVAAFDGADMERLLADPGIVRNRLKIRAAVTNARAVLALRGREGLDALVWSFQPARHSAPRRLVDIDATSPASIALARALKSAGFGFVGPTTMYALMQACGLVDDHLAGCHRSGTRVLPSCSDPP